MVNLRFADSAPVSVGEDAGWMKYFAFSKDDIMGIAEKGVMALLGLIVLLMVVRPLVRRILTPEATDSPMEALTADGAPMVQLTGPDGEKLALPAPRNETSEAIDSARADGESQAKAVDEVGETVKNSPDEAVSIIRDWLHKTA